MQQVQCMHRSPFYKQTNFLPYLAIFLYLIQTCKTKRNDLNAVPIGSSRMNYAVRRLNWVLVDRGNTYGTLLTYHNFYSR